MNVQIDLPSRVRSHYVNSRRMSMRMAVLSRQCVLNVYDHRVSSGTDLAGLPEWVVFLVEYTAVIVETVGYKTVFKNEAPLRIRPENGWHSPFKPGHWLEHAATQPLKHMKAHHRQWHDDNQGQIKAPNALLPRMHAHESWVHRYASHTRWAQKYRQRS